MNCRSDLSDDNFIYLFIFNINLPAFSLFMGNLNADKSFEEIKEGISKFFKKEGLDIQDVRLGGSK